MAVEVTLTLTCGRCARSCTAVAPLTGKNPERLRVNARSARLPEGWWLGFRSDGYGTGREIVCGCPKHAEELRGYPLSGY